MSQIDYCSSTLLSHGVASLAFDGAGNLYAANFPGGSVGTIVKITSSGAASLFATNPDGGNIPFAGVAYSALSNCLFATGYNTKVYKINITTGAVTTLTSSLGVIGSAGLISSGGVLVVCCNGAGTPGNGAVYTVNETSGAVSSFLAGSLFTGYPSYIVQQVTGNFLITDSGTGTRVQQFASGGSSINSNFITGISYPGNIALDSAGNVYVTSNNTNFVSKYTSAGSLVSSTFAVGGKNSSASVLYPPGGGLTFDSTGTYYYVVTTNNVNDSSPGVIQTNYQPANGNVVCFKEGTKILCKMPSGAEGYRTIERLRNGDKVKTLNNGSLPIILIGKKTIHHPASEKRIKDQLYKCSKDKYPELFEDLIVTGCHSILVDDFTSEEERKKTIEVNGNTFVTDRKYRLPACADDRAEVYEIPGSYKIYHFALEHEDYYVNYGVYANGLLVESCSKRNLTELGCMNLIGNGDN